EHDENLIKDRQSYRLPTDREWSTAVGLPNETGGTPEARDGKIKNEFPWGKQWPPPAGAGNYPAGAGQRRGTTMPVGNFKPNALGLYDLGGNAWEWQARRFNRRNPFRLKRSIRRLFAAGLARARATAAWRT